MTIVKSVAATMQEAFSSQPSTAAVQPRDPLPASTRAKFIALQGQADDARAAASSAQARISDLEKMIGSGATSQAEAAGIEQELGRLRAVRSVQNGRHADLAALVANIRHWLELLNGRALEVAEPVAVKPQKDETFLQAIGRIRGQIDGFKREFRAVAVAPLPKSALKVEATEFVRRTRCRR